MSFDRTSDQRTEALQKANETRARRAKLKDDLKSGRTAVSDVIARPPEFAATMKVTDLLGALRGFGRVKVDKVLGQCGVATSKRLGGLTPRQRHDLTYELRRARPVISDAYLTTRTVQGFGSSTFVQGGAT